MMQRRPQPTAEEIADALEALSERLGQVRKGRYAPTTFQTETAFILQDLINLVGRMAGFDLEAAEERPAQEPAAIASAAYEVEVTFIASGNVGVQRQRFGYVARSRCEAIGFGITEALRAHAGAMVTAIHAALKNA